MMNPHGDSVYGLLIVLVAIYYMSPWRSSGAGDSSGGITPTTNPAQAPAPHMHRADASLDRICTALFALSRISPSDPDNAPTPFGLLGLDPNAAPFHPVEQSAVVGTAQHAEVQAAVFKASARVKRSVWPKHERGDEMAKRVVEALWHVGFVLLSDETRLYFMARVQPRLEGPSRWFGKSTASQRAGVVRDMCWDVWRSHGWDYYG